MFELSAIGIEWGSLLLLGMLLVLLLLGMPLSFVTSFVAMFFLLFWIGPKATPLLASRIYAFISSYVFIAVPMFVLMAAILDRSSIATDLFNAMRLVSGRLRGGVAIQTLLVAVLLAAMSGIIGGEIVLLGLLALPQMLKQKYDPNLAIGTVVAGGALGSMVPPSIVLIIYGLIANVSISDLFTSSFVPGFMLASMYVAYVLVRAYSNPSVAPIASDQELDAPLREKLVAFKGVILPVLVAFMVLGSIYSGIASVTEASGLGVIGILISTWVRKELTFKLIKESTIRTLETVGMIIWIGIGASILVGVYNLMGGIRFIESLILSFGDGEPIYILFLMMGILFILGMFLDWVGIALLTLPIFVPIINQIGYDPIWFGVVFSLNMQLSFLTPPFGPAAFYLKSVAPPEISLGMIFKAVVPFIALQIVALVLLIVFPELALWWRS
ncbi:putative TRAP-type C4-dicarboxylate transport system, large permease component DctM subunit [Vibrio nigripulchritudo SFn27]|uniref:TRAP transporter large permease protein n=1 Tax=Vibrio nigripulchritudo TaxID=28173 RepID=U4KFI9_9VIBR|nr:MULTISPECIES: TRAP transporter large permease subunit [Vibrio]UAB68846.1 TRAP transporter large permease subunit [Vibrio sp. SCSIO 43132]CCN84119.1 putative TRAP-type C4-dicarboxylate transport system, large permease component DctM subunit [Vibrio nigripulchritudo BLFn1]CCN87034.1 putative TRAP-type C4-dicarboxylate transport system, large permease component DctM subunit [Vibrio nigripulchritudo SFn27]CCN93261.1 putative TRAP-type C4-dicarboxylate transport system, large permease component D